MRHSDDNIILIYQNTPCAVFGNFQNPYKELSSKLVLEKKIPVFRRITGGGCVYHDLGMLIFSFISHQNINPDQNIQFIRDNIFQFTGINAVQGEKYDILMKGLDGSLNKISGSALKKIKNRQLHHCTLLVNSQIDFFDELFMPFNINCLGKSLPSRRAKCQTLADIKHDCRPELLLNQFKEKYRPIYFADYLDQVNVSDLNNLKLIQEKIESIKFRLMDLIPFVIEIPLLWKDSETFFSLSMDVDDGVVQKVDFKWLTELPPMGPKIMGEVFHISQQLKGLSLFQSKNSDRELAEKINLVLQKIQAKLPFSGINRFDHLISHLKFMSIPS